MELELELKEFVTVQLDKNMHDLLSDISAKTGVKIKVLVSKCVYESVYEKQKLLKEVADVDNENIKATAGKMGE